MRKFALLLPLLPSVALAGPYKTRLLDALDALEAGRSAAKKGSGDCRTALLGNFDSAIRDVEDARGRPSSKRVEQIQLFVAGMALSAGLAGCPDRVVENLSDAQQSLTRAKGLAMDAEDDRDERDDRRSRRDRYRDDDDDRDDRDDRRSRRDRDRDRDDDDRYERALQKPRGPQPMAEADFNALVRAVGAETFGQQKCDVVQAASRGYFTVDQVGRLVDQLTFGADKVKVVSILNTRIIDPQNNYKLYERFTFSSDKEKVKQILNGR
jgi:hypothetical protein